MSKSNGKKVVGVILGLVLGLSFFAYIVQQKIDANRGKPLKDESAEEASKAPVEN